MLHISQTNAQLPRDAENESAEQMSAQAKDVEQTVYSVETTLNELVDTLEQPTLAHGRGQAGLASVAEERYK